MQTIGVGVGVCCSTSVQDGSFFFGFSYGTLPYQGFQFSLFKIEGKDSHKCQTAYRP